MKEIMIAKTLAAQINKSAKWYCGCRSPICNKEFVLLMNRGSNLFLTETSTENLKQISALVKK